jgi:hypothetical protein
LNVKGRGLRRLSIPKHKMDKGRTGPRDNESQSQQYASKYASSILTGSHLCLSYMTGISPVPRILCMVATYCSWFILTLWPGWKGISIFQLQLWNFLWQTDWRAWVVSLSTGPMTLGQRAMNDHKWTFTGLLFTPILQSNNSHHFTSLPPEVTAICLLFSPCLSPKASLIASVIYHSLYQVSVVPGCLRQPFS